MNMPNHTKPWPTIPKNLNETEVSHTVQVARGGSSRVFAVPGYDRRVIYKKYFEPRERPPLDLLVTKYAELDSTSSHYIREHLAWPVTTVHNTDDQAVGTLVVQAPEGFTANLSTGRARIRDLNFLLYEERAARVNVQPATTRQKIGLLHELVSVLHWLQEQGLVHEDLAAHNLLWRLDEKPAVFVLDCDSLRLLSDENGQPLFTTPDWTDPRVLGNEIPRPDNESTSYAVGLLVARVLGSPYWRPAPGRIAPPSEESFPPELGPFVTKACNRSASERPNLEEWLIALEGAATDTDRPALDRTTAPAADPTPTKPPPVQGRPVALYDRLAFAIGLAAGGMAAVLVLVRFL